jgi:hypothetical protein
MERLSAADARYANYPKPYLYQRQPDCIQDEGHA